MMIFTRQSRWMPSWAVTTCWAGPILLECGWLLKISTSACARYRRHSMLTRRAILPDVEQVHKLISEYSHDGTLLPRNLAELSENVRDFIVVEDGGEIIACGALHFYGRHLTEIRSIAVYPKHKGKGAGRVLIDALLEEAEHHKITCVCRFIQIPDFF